MPVECVCKKCGQSFNVPPRAIKRGQGKYCSRPCYDTSQRRTVMCTCERCGKMFSRRPSEVGRRQYCSRECANNHLHRIEVVCKTCGIVFGVWPAKVKLGHGKYCSTRCWSTAPETWVGRLRGMQTCSRTRTVYTRSMMRRFIEWSDSTICAFPLCQRAPSRSANGNKWHICATHMRGLAQTLRRWQRQASIYTENL